MSSIPVGRRFRSAVPEDDDLLVLVADIAVTVSAEPVWAITQHAFDTERVLEESIPCPAARQVQRRLGMPWRDVVCTALNVPAPTPSPTAPRTLGLRRGPYSRDECIRALRAYLDGLAPTDPPTIRSYRDWCRHGTGRPWPGSLTRHGGFRTLLAAARRPDVPACPIDELIGRSRSPHATAVLRVLDDAGWDWLTCAQIAARTRTTRRTVGDRLRRLEYAGAVERNLHGPPGPAMWWTLTTAGRIWITRRRQEGSAAGDRAGAA